MHVSVPSLLPPEAIGTSPTTDATISRFNAGHPRSCLAEVVGKQVVSELEENLASARFYLLPGRSPPRTRERWQHDQPLPKVTWRLFHSELE